MKIAYIYDAVYPWVGGGAEKRVYEIAKRIAQNGHEVHWYCIGWWLEENPQNDIEMDGIHLHAVSKPMDLYVNGKRSIKEAVYFGLKLIPVMLREKFDIIDCQEFPYFSCFSSRLNSSSTLVITWYEVWNDYWFDYIGKMGYFGRFIEKMTLKLPKFIVPISDQIKKDLINMDIPKNKIRVVPNGVEFPRLQEIKPSNEKFDILYVGRLISHKNVDVLLKTIAIVKETIPDISCGIIGSGPEIDNLKSLSKKLALENNVKFLGFVKEDDDVYAYMKSSKLFVLPSTREGFPNTILEANACGLPVIIVYHEKNAGIGVVENGYNGYILDLSPEEISKKVIYLMENENELQSLNENSINFAKEYDWNIIVKKIEEVYKEALK